MYKENGSSNSQAVSKGTVKDMFLKMEQKWLYKFSYIPNWILRAMLTQ